MLVVCGLQIPALNGEWIEKSTRTAASRLDRIDNDLKTYKSNSIKDAIRRGNDDLGDHYMDVADLRNAIKAYLRSRDYCSTAKHTLAMCLNVIKVPFPLSPLVFCLCLHTAVYAVYWCSLQLKRF